VGLFGKGDGFALQASPGFSKRNDTVFDLFSGRDRVLPASLIDYMGPGWGDA
jgi:hypothetical protein